MYYNILLTRTTAAQNVVALSYHIMRGLYFLAVVFVTSIVAMHFITPVLECRVNELHFTVLQCIMYSVYCTLAVYAVV